MPVNRSDLVGRVAESTDLPPVVVDQALAGLMEGIAQALADGDAVNIRTFGKFEPRKRRPVTRLNPATREPIDVPAQISVGFVPSKNLKAKLND